MNVFLDFIKLSIKKLNLKRYIVGTTRELEYKKKEERIDRIYKFLIKIKKSYFAASRKDRLI